MTDIEVMLYLLNHFPKLFFRLSLGTLFLKGLASLNLTKQLLPFELTNKLTISDRFVNAFRHFKFETYGENCFFLLDVSTGNLLSPAGIDCGERARRIMRIHDHVRTLGESARQLI